jgi:hypothetical protein
MLIIIAKSFQPRSKLARHPGNAGQKNVSREAGGEKRVVSQFEICSLIFL